MSNLKKIYRKITFLFKKNMIEGVLLHDIWGSYYYKIGDTISVSNILTKQRNVFFVEDIDKIIQKPNYRHWSREDVIINPTRILLLEKKQYF